MKHLLLGLTLLCSLNANAAQNIFEVMPDETNPQFGTCRFQDYTQGAKLISTYLQSQMSAKYLSQCDAAILKDVQDGERKQVAMLPAIESQVDACYSAADIELIKSTTKKVLDQLPKFCESKNVSDAMADWVTKLNAEK
jgi:hypothetical protein